MARELDDLEIAILGCGAVGAALAEELVAAGTSPRLWSRDPERARDLAARLGAPASAVQDLAQVLGGVDLALVCVSDEALEEVAGSMAAAAEVSAERELAPVALHTNGFRGPDALAALDDAGWVTGRIHPLVALPPRATRPLPLRGAWFAVDGDALARDTAHAVVAVAGGRALTLEPDEDGVYHAAATLLSSGLVALVEASTGLLAPVVEGGAERARLALQGLLESTVENLAVQTPAEALTGAAARGATEVVRGHLAALEARDPELARLYAALARRTLDLAAARGTLDAARRAELERLLGEGGAAADAQNSKR